MKQFFCELLFACTIAAPVGAPIEDLTYGTVLFEYYQEDYQQALLVAEVAKHQDRRGEHQIKFDLATGSFAFADRMYGYANEVFATIPEGELSKLDEMRLAFHLSREYHRQGAWHELSEQLAKIELGKTWLRGKQITHPEVEFMRAELAVQQGDYNKAQQHFRLMGDNHPLAAYGLYNLGIAYREAGQLANAAKTFRYLSKRPAYNNEAADLVQRARLALALIARAQNNQPRAESVLKDLPSTGRYQEVAMAAFGGLAMDNEDYELAARIWMTLQQQDYWTPSTATARLGFPLSLEKLAVTGRTTPQQALNQFQLAEQSFEGRLQTLQQLQLQASDSQWIQGLLQVFATPNQDEDQMRVLMGKWEKQLGHTDWLEWLSREEVHELLGQWRDLSGMENWLTELPNHLGALQEVAAEQHSRGSLARSMLHEDGLLQQRTQLVSSIEQQANTINGIKSSTAQPSVEWMYPLATPEEREVLQELQRMEQLVALMPEGDQSKWQARIKRLKGMYFYRIVAERAQREQQLNQVNRSMHGLVADIDERLTRVGNAQQEFNQGVGAKLQSFLAQADGLTERVVQARSHREEMLAQEIRGRMQQEVQQVEEYLLVTRIAIARATDQLAMTDANVESSELSTRGGQ